MTGSGSAASGETGMVTAELAVVLPALILVLAVALSALGLVVDQVRCVDAATAAARAAARGDSTAAVHAVAARSAPSGSSVATTVGGGLVTVTVSAGRARLGGLVPLPLHPGASATAQLEAAGGGAP
jgi:hypothetical protein